MAQGLSEGAAGSPRVGEDGLTHVRRARKVPFAPTLWGLDLVSHWEILLLFPSDLLNLPQDDSCAAKDVPLCWKCPSSAPRMLSSLGHACFTQP